MKPAAANATLDAANNNDNETPTHRTACTYTAKSRGYVAAVAIDGSPWLIVTGLPVHGFKDLWQHGTQFVATTRW